MSTREEGGKKENLQVFQWFLGNFRCEKKQVWKNEKQDGKI